MIDYWPLIGIALVVVGFALRFNPLLVVFVAATATGLEISRTPKVPQTRFCPFLFILNWARTR